VPLIAGNWKMNMTSAKAIGLVEGIFRRVDSRPDVDVVVCPPFTALSPVRDTLRNTHIMLGAQNMFWLEQGAYTGQISPNMLIDLNVEFVILGHSECRGRFGVPDPAVEPFLCYFSDTDDTVNAKVKTALYHSITPIVCVGETLAERQAGKTDEVVASMLAGALQDVDADETYGLVIAYEPVWAIGTGQVCEEAEANRVCGFIRERLGEIANPEAASNIRVLYGGSVKGSNSPGLFKQPEIDGALVGGASLDVEEFVQIVMTAHPHE